MVLQVVRMMEPVTESGKLVSVRARPPVRRDDRARPEVRRDNRIRARPWVRRDDRAHPWLGASRHGL